MIRLLGQSAELLLKHSGGQYSPIDMAQYVFWTGDEEGVAKAVDEFIEKGIVSTIVFPLSSFEVKQLMSRATEINWHEIGFDSLAIFTFPFIFFLLDPF